MDNWIIYAPCTLFVLTTLLNIKIFARSEDLSKLKADLMTYAAEHFVTKDTYSDSQKALQSHMLQIHNEISDVKNMLITFFNGNLRN